MELPQLFPLSSLDFASGDLCQMERRLAEETPIAFEYNGLGYAVMMATPRDLDDFAIGFTLSEGMVDEAGEVGAITAAEVEGGVILRIELPPAAADLLRERLRLRLVEGSCGLCGLESIEEVLRPIPPIAGEALVDRAGIAAALDQLPNSNHCPPRPGRCMGLPSAHQKAKFWRSARISGGIMRWTN